MADWLRVLDRKLVKLDRENGEIIKEIDMETVKNPSKKGLPYPLKFYKYFYWCKRGKHWVRKKDVEKARNGRLICPVHHTGLRTRRIHHNRYGEDNRPRISVEA